MRFLKLTLQSARSLVVQFWNITLVEKKKEIITRVAAKEERCEAYGFMFSHSI